MGTSMGLILQIKGKAAEEFLEKSKTASITKEAFKKCLELSKDVEKR